MLRVFTMFMLIIFSQFVQSCWAHEECLNTFLNDLDMEIRKAQEHNDKCIIVCLLHKHLEKDLMSEFILGKFKYGQNEETIKRFYKAHQNYFIEQYSEQLMQSYNTIKIINSKFIEPNIYIVDTIITTSNNNYVENEYTILKKGDNQYKIADVKIQGIKLSITNRSEVYSVLENHNIEWYIERLNNQTSSKCDCNVKG